MNARVTVAFLFAAITWGQNSAQLFTFKYTVLPAGMQQITNAVRTVPELQSVTVDTNAKTLTAEGTQAQLAMATWIFNTLDQTAPANAAAQQYLPPGSTNDVVRVLYSSNQQTARSFQEIVNTIRVIPEMTKVFPVTGQVFAIVIRGTTTQTNMGEWVFHQIDVPLGLQPAQDTAAHQYVSPVATNDVTQVLYLNHKWTPQSMQEIVNAVRSIPELTRVFPCTGTGALSLRGSADKVALGTWLFQQFDRETQSGEGPQQYPMPGRADDVTRIFYLAPATTPQQVESAVNAVRAKASQRAFPSYALRAVAVRGTAAQIAAADLAMKQ